MDFSKYEALIFDCDGTLTLSMPIHFIAWRETMIRHGITFSEERFYSMAGMPSDKVISTLAEEQKVEIADIESVMDEKEDHFLRNMHQLEPFDFTVEIAKKYQGQKPMAVASGGNLPVVTAQLDHLGITELFDTIVTAEHTDKHKPNPDVFLEAAGRLGVVSANCIVFEDGDLGIEAAKRANMDFVDVREFL